MGEQGIFLKCIFLDLSKFDLPEAGSPIVKAESVTELSGRRISCELAWTTKFVIAIVVVVVFFVVALLISGSGVDF